jgi:restriction endonuclease S subunit
MTWDKKRIKDFAKVVTGGTPSTKNKDYWSGGTIPWLNSGELNQDIVLKSGNFITEDGLKNSAAKMMPPDTVLIALTGATTGVVGYLTFAACANQSVTGILPSESHYPKYLYYYLKSIRQKVLDLSYGGAQYHISQGFVQNIEVPLPPLPEQKRIAAILDHADAIRRKNREIFEKYNQLAQSVFLEMFGDPHLNNKGWPKKRLGDLCKVTKLAGFEYTQYVRYKDAGEIIVIRGLNVKDGKLKLDEVKFIDKEISDLLFRSKLYENDVVMTYIGVNIGDVAIIRENEKYHLAPNVAKITPLDFNVLDSTFLMKMLQFHRLQFQKYTTNTAKQALNMGNIRELEIQLPSIQLQRKYTEVFNNIDSLKEKIIMQRGKSEELFQSLLQRAFRGEL